MRNLILFSVVVVTLIVAIGIGVVRRGAAHERASELRGQGGDVSRALAVDGPHAKDPRGAGADVARAEEQRAADSQPPVFGSAQNVPHIGSVQVLNGCGAEGAANRVAEFLRTKYFDVKYQGNAPTWNYPATMIISRTLDMSLANEVEKVMRTGKVVLIRNGDELYDVTVVAGPDFEERIK